MDQQNDDQRGSTRRKALKGARIVFNNGWAAINCRVRNVSEAGAAVHVEQTLSIPEEFQLVFDDGSPPRQCKVMWRNPTVLGVEFG